MHVRCPQVICQHTFKPFRKHLKFWLDFKQRLKSQFSDYKYDCKIFWRKYLPLTNAFKVPWIFDRWNANKETFITLACKLINLQRMKIRGSLSSLAIYSVSSNSYLSKEGIQGMFVTKNALYNMLNTFIFSHLDYVITRPMKEPETCSLKVCTT